MSKQLSVAEVLNRAADLIEPEGKWMQGQLARDCFGAPLEAYELALGECFCASGAIGAVGAVAGNQSLWVKAYHCVSLHVGETLIRFNDTPGRTQAEVVAALRAAAKQAEAA